MLITACFNPYVVMIYLLLSLLPVLFVILLSNLPSVDSKIEDSFQKLCNSFACKVPIVNDQNLSVQIVYQGDFKFEPTQLSPVSTMAFSGQDILIMNKNNGTIYRIKNGTFLETPLLDVTVANKRERGLLGITGTKNDNGTENIFLYYTESQRSDGTDICHDNNYCEPSTNPLGNRLYKYELENNKLINPKLLLDLPAAPGATHNGGVLKIGPDKNLYLVIGDLAGSINESSSTQAQNFKNGSIPDGRAGILRITQDGKPVGNGILSDEFPTNLYYAYGIRNSFGIDFDPITGNLWDTENGPEYGDEINLVSPGFNSGWNTIQGIWKPIWGTDPNLGNIAGEQIISPKDIVDFGGNGNYSMPEFIWKESVGPTAIKFLSSDKLGKNYENDLFVGSVHLGSIFHFDLNNDRTNFELDGPLKDKISNTTEELQSIVFSKGLGAVTDIEVGPDGYMYVLSNYKSKATIFKIAPKEAN
jgi:aldose sugar dehydrogenase